MWTLLIFGLLAVTTGGRAQTQLLGNNVNRGVIRGTSSGRPVGPAGSYPGTYGLTGFGNQNSYNFGSANGVQSGQPLYQRELSEGVIQPAIEMRIPQQFGNPFVDGQGQGVSVMKSHSLAAQAELPYAPAPPPFGPGGPLRPRHPYAAGNGRFPPSFEAAPLLPYPYSQGNQFDYPFQAFQQQPQGVPQKSKDSVRVISASQSRPGVTDDGQGQPQFGGPLSYYPGLQGPPEEYLQRPQFSPYSPQIPQHLLRQGPGRSPYRLAPQQFEGGPEVSPISEGPEHAIGSSDFDGIDGGSSPPYPMAFHQSPGRHLSPQQFHTIEEYDQGSGPVVSQPPKKSSRGPSILSSAATSLMASLPPRMRHLVFSRNGGPSPSNFF